MAQCGSNPTNKPTENAAERGVTHSESISNIFPYDLSNPTNTFELDASLREISGLTKIGRAHV